MVRYYKKDKGRLVELSERVPNCWINISPPFTQEELENMSEELEIPIEFFIDSLDLEERSRYETEDDIRLIVLKSPLPNKFDDFNRAFYFTVPIGIILTLDHIITITSFENPILDLFLKNRVKNFDPAEPARFVLQIMEQNVYRFLNCLKDLNTKRNLLERELYNSSRNEELKELLSIEKSLVYFVTNLSANELLKMKMKRTNYLRIKDDEDLTDLFDAIIIDNSQALEMANTSANILSGTMTAFASIISNNLNRVIQRLTLITIMLMVPNLVTSFFGMNLSMQGLEQNPYAIGYVLVGSVVLTLLLVAFFRRKRMF